MVLVDSVAADLLGRQPQQVAPLQRPELGIFGPIEQAIDQLGALVRRRIREKRRRLFDRRRDADHVQIDAADEFLVRASRRRQELQLLQLLVHQLVDVVVPRRIVPGETFDVADERQEARLDVFQVADQDRRLAPFVPHDQAIDRDRGDLFVGAGKDGQLRHVAHRAVGEMSQHEQLLRVSGRFKTRPLGGYTSSLTHRGVFGGIEPAAFGDPFAQAPGYAGSAVSQLQAAAVRNLHQRLQQQQTLFRLERIGAATEVLANQR